MAKPIRCPGLACGGSMYPERRQGVTADRCDRCSGLWFDARELDGWLVDAGSRRPGQAESQIPARGIGSRPCPRCDHALETAGWTDLVLDRCRSCGGLFVEANEFVRMTKLELPTDDVAVASRFAELMVTLGSTVLAAGQIAMIIMRFLRR